jgi:hypothetical protein
VQAILFGQIVRLLSGERAEDPVVKIVEGWSRYRTGGKRKDECGRDSHSTS